MRIKVDEDLPYSVADLLRRHGHDALTVTDQELRGSTDAALWAVVQTEGRFFITADKGFADVRRHPPGEHAGIMLLRPDEDGIPALQALLAAVLRETDLETLAGTVSVATPRGLRVRRPAQ